jgi:hypothetical protein
LAKLTRSRTGTNDSGKNDPPQGSYGAQSKARMARQSDSVRTNTGTVNRAHQAPWGGTAEMVGPQERMVNPPAVLRRGQASGGSRRAAASGGLERSRSDSPGSGSGQLIPSSGSSQAIPCSSGAEAREWASTRYCRVRSVRA